RRSESANKTQLFPPLPKIFFVLFRTSLKTFFALLCSAPRIAKRTVRKIQSFLTVISALRSSLLLSRKKAKRESKERKSFVLMESAKNTKASEPESSEA
ncbi:MAG: hypothetical protein RSB29_03455, partial [Alistipes sp.]